MMQSAAEATSASSPVLCIPGELDFRSTAWPTHEAEVHSEDRVYGCCFFKCVGQFKEEETKEQEKQGSEGQQGDRGGQESVFRPPFRCQIGARGRGGEGNTGPHRPLS